MNRNNMVYKRVTITLPKETVLKLKKIAKKDNRTMSNMIKHLIEKQP